ncbi:hypothetical protein CKO31_14280 [Thiohalocapsa halophila]|uniref:Sulfotransferase domain-containing protein n=1 Tax=Thiohalocapsa halophila TaxID=69359 RepID=A0ABS1CIX6_9GAMM|nr:sulfotransferase [Thiohalocapsa halophila]MBK1631881.1 hypothetical protein [Thiohalocapsa halophila]
MKSGFFVIAGFQKCASTWLHRALQAHPDVFLPDEHMLHFFDIHFDRGIPWYQRLFETAAPSQIVGDATVTYARSALAMQRIARLDSSALVVLILRNPIDRAWSHYWHERKKGKIAFEFEEWESNYDLYSDWILPGMYDQHIDLTESLFGRDQVLVIFQDDVAVRPVGVLSSVFNFLGVDHDRAVEVGAERKRINSTVIGKGSAGRLSFFAKWKERREREAYAAGPSKGAVARLSHLYRPMVRELEARYNRDLERWLRPSA